MPEASLSDAPAGAPSSSLAGRAREVLTGDAEVPTPCISVCRMDEARGWCMGCLRTCEELREWRALDDAGKRVIWGRIEQRLADVAASQVEPA